MKRQGHRQSFTELRITGIPGAGTSSVAATDTSGEA
jgi:hypothetical protein